MLHRKAAPSTPDPYCHIKVASELRQALNFRCLCDVIKTAICQACRTGTFITVTLIGTNASMGHLDGVGRWLQHLL
jgi:hypothetical protein